MYLNHGQSVGRLGIASMTARGRCQRGQRRTHAAYAQRDNELTERAVRPS